jgi:cholinesterase
MAPATADGKPAFNVMTCGAAETAKARVLHNVPVWRYNFANNKPGETRGAGIGADILAVFTDGTTGFSKVFQPAWAAFVKDPTNGLSKLGWPRYDATGKPSDPQLFLKTKVLIVTGNTLVRIGHDGALSADFPKANTYDGECELQL